MTTSRDELRAHTDNAIAHIMLERQAGDLSGPGADTVLRAAGYMAAEVVTEFGGDLPIPAAGRLLVAASSYLESIRTQLGDREFPAHKVPLVLLNVLALTGEQLTRETGDTR